MGERLEYGRLAPGSAGETPALLSVGRDAHKILNFMELCPIRGVEASV